MASSALTLPGNASFRNDSSITNKQGPSASDKELSISPSVLSGIPPSPQTNTTLQRESRLSLLTSSNNDTTKRPDSYAGLAQSLTNKEQNQGNESRATHGFVLENGPPPVVESPQPLTTNREEPSVVTTRNAAPPSGLDALATLASEARSVVLSSSSNNGQPHSSPTMKPLVVAHLERGLLTTSPLPNTSSGSNSENDEEEEDDMPPPPPRRRPRSVSNPEGMEKWDSLNSASPASCYHHNRRHFVLPAAILEEELAEASAIIQQRNEQQQQQMALQQNNQLRQATIPEEHEVVPQYNMDAAVEEEEEDEEEAEEEAEGIRSGSSPDSVVDHPHAFMSTRQKTMANRAITSNNAPSATVVLAAKQSGRAVGVGADSDNNNESHLTPEDLLKRARSRLLEDLSEGNMNGEKGVLTLPHSLSKYKEVYNKNGRIGIYTPAERAAIIARFNKKRQRRVWNKKIRYNCRKSLADRRLRVKGRFVKRSEQEQLKKEIKARVEQKTVVAVDNATAAATTTSPNGDERVDHDGDEHMPDVNDPEAGFAPTEDQPYRRLRRHTIT